MINLTREEAQQVLDALEDVMDDAEEPHKTKNAFEFLRAKLSEPKQEPVAWAVVDGNKIEHVSYTRANSESWLKYVATRKLVPLYTAPPQREWVGLTDEELEFYTEELGLGELGRGVLRAVVDFLKEKNT